PTGPQHGLPVIANIPSQAQARLEHLGGVGNLSRGRKARNAQVHSVGGFRRRNHRIRENLRLPSQALLHSNVWTTVPLVLQEERVVLIADIGGSGSGRGGSTRARVLEVKQQRAGSGRPAAGAGGADAGYEGSVRAFGRGWAEARSC